MAIRILLLTQLFDPEPTSKGLVFARELVRRGFEVEVLTGFPNYPGGKVYQGYRIKFIQHELIDGVQVTRVPLYPSHDGSALKRVLTYFSFAFTSCVYGIFFAKKTDVIYVYHPPMTVGLSGALIGFFRKTPFVYDIQDLWPDTLRATDMMGNPHILKWVATICDWIYSKANHIVVLSEGFRDTLIERGVGENKISLIYNWCDEAGLRLPEAGSDNLDFMTGRFNVVFAGTMGKAQALSAVIQAARLVELKNANVQFVFVGGGVEVDALKSLVSSLCLNNVRFLPRMPMSEVGAVLARADALLVHLKDDPLFAITIPSKTQAYLAVGKPIIIGVRGEAAALISSSGAGIAVEPENSGSIAEAVLRIASLSAADRQVMGDKAVKFYAEKMSLNTGANKFDSIFKQVSGNNKNE
ncbi:MAG: glycosyltransferase family 4 protein [Thiothrix sp.]|uniref:glycosyltransferase family 4 protein n=1 Tax=Thiothrix sp. TaxID=1032 RepID=UPI00262747FF|nr:glycosyltransferase family 4 protein [Thiothrix sp.]MDD5395540.1 glycosyltransferase family 4 protein [Thiothrix sp.]